MIPLFVEHNTDPYAIELFNSEMEDLYQMLFGASCSSFDQDVWHETFTNEKSRKIELDFNDFNTPELTFLESIPIQISDEQYVSLTPCGFAKWLFLKVKFKDRANYRCIWYLDNLKMLFRYLFDNQISSLSNEHLESYLGILLTHNYVNNTFVRRYSSPAYASRLKWLHMIEMGNILKLHKLDCFIDPIDKSEYNQKLNNACLTHMDMTLADYEKGESFDYLGLDIGKFYIDYCANYYEENLLVATAVSVALLEMGFSLSESGDSTRWKELLDHTTELNKTFCKQISYIIIEKTVVIEAFKHNTLNYIAKEIGLDEWALDTHEFIRAMLYARFYEQNIKSRESIFEEFQSCVNDELNRSNNISNVSFKNLKIKDFDQIVDQICLANFVRISDINSYLLSLNITCKAKLKSYLLNVEAAGVTTLVAYTGYRASEYGFPENSIFIEANAEIRDAVYTPFRFNLKWKVPKTNGEVKLKREITLSSTVLSHQLAELTRVENNSFALFSKNKTSKTEVSRIVYELVNRLWFDFPYKYNLFVDLDVLENKDLPQSECNILAQKYDLSLPSVKDLVSLKNELRLHSKIRKLSMREYRYENGSAINFIKTLELFKKNMLPIEERKLIEHKLDTATISIIKKPGFVLNKESVDAIRNEFIAGTHYATPHALRHVWAEAVLRRYKGDVGKRIRTNFKHMDNRFFNAYINSKEVKAIMDIAKITTINSIVKYNINKLKDDKSAYVTGFQRFIKKACYVTKTDSERSNLAKIISENRIVELNVSPTNDCLLRIGTFSNAKCSEDGQPRPYLAKPSLCLGCTNVNFEESHYDGTMVYIKQDIEILRDKGLPLWLKRESLDTVTKALTRIKMLNTENQIFDKAINYLQQSIDIARSQEVES